MSTLNDHILIMNKLVSLQGDLDEKLCVFIFGKRLGQHLISKYYAFEKNIVWFYNSLDRQNRVSFSKYLSKL
jgi:hypothetical protein